MLGGPGPSGADIFVWNSKSYEALRLLLTRLLALCNLKGRLKSTARNCFIIDFRLSKASSAELRATLPFGSPFPSRRGRCKVRLKSCKASVGVRPTPIVPAAMRLPENATQRFGVIATRGRNIAAGVPPCCNRNASAPFLKLGGRFSSLNTTI